MIHEFTVYIETADDYVPPTSDVLQDVLQRHFDGVHSRMSFEVEERSD